MGGAIAVVVVLLVFPVVFLMSMAVVAAVLGTLLKNDGERRNADSELLNLNV